jgi:hypothetical protein
VIPGIESYLPHFSRALADEIAQIRKGGGQKTYVSDGRRLGTRDGLFIYSFTADTELRFPDDTPVDLEYHGRKHEGRILSIDGFDLILALIDDIGSDIPNAILHTEPWFLLQQLQERVYELRTSKDANKTLAARLLAPHTQAQTGQPQQTAQLLQPLRRQLGAAFHCNLQQLRAVSQVLANDVTFIWGPPGTGKTSTLGMTVAALVAAGESVLVVAHSNAAVDVAMQGIARNMQATPTYSEGKILRFGIVARTELAAYPSLHVRGIVRAQHPQLIDRIETAEERRRKLIAESRRTGLSSSEQQHIKDQIAFMKVAATQAVRVRPRPRGNRGWLYPVQSHDCAGNLPAPL